VASVHDTTSTHTSQRDNVMCTTYVGRFKVPNDDIKRAILTLDTTILDLDSLQMLLALLPTSGHHQPNTLYLHT
jgi:hypothetical protein